MGKVAPAFHEDTNCYARKRESAGQQGAGATPCPDAGDQVSFTAACLRSSTESRSTNFERQ